MGTLTPKDGTTPRYLRYKAEEKNADYYWDKELERANSILHNRVVRMQRDTLCTGCARFDFLRTHFYTRECTPSDETKANEFRKVDKNADRPLGHQYQRYLTDVQDDVQWHSFETIQGIEEEVKLLAQHPEFKWKFENEQELVCILCKMLLQTAKATHEAQKLSWTTHAKDVVVNLMAGPLFEEGGRHECHEGWLSHGPQETNSLIVDFWGYRGRLTTVYIRPIIQEMEGLSVNMREPMPHYCVMQHNVQACVNFNILNGWLQRCDEKHEHISDLRIAHRELSDFRLIDVKNQCIVETDRHTRYAALSYTWGSGGQYCLTKANKHLLERSGSLQKISQELRPVINDSITACARLKIPYLWVDALCIVQDDAVRKHHQIKNMDLIYANAYITIVAAGEKKGSSQPKQNSIAGLARVTIPAVSARTGLTITMDGVLYSYSERDVLSPLDQNMSHSTWFSRGWTFQELVLSQRILVFTSEEVFIYCPSGILAESVCMGDDPYVSLPSKNRNIQLCGHLHDSRTYHKPSSIGTYADNYFGSYLYLLKLYMKRDLTYDNEGLDAFSGVMNAQSHILGEFYWGLPQTIFARALLTRLDSPKSRRPTFPSWSWLGWKMKESEGHSAFPDYPLPLIFPLVHIYKHDEQSSLDLLLGPWDWDNGIEGYCSEVIDNYNLWTGLDALPIEPSIDNFSPFSGQETLPMLIFWTHVAHFKMSELTECILFFDESDTSKTHLTEIDVILIASGKATFEMPWTDLFGIVIERHSGYASRIGTMIYTHFSFWLSGNPQKELIRLI